MPCLRLLLFENLEQAFLKDQRLLITRAVRPPTVIKGEMLKLHPVVLSAVVKDAVGEFRNLRQRIVISRRRAPLGIENLPPNWESPLDIAPLEMRGRATTRCSRFGDRSVRGGPRIQ